MKYIHLLIATVLLGFGQLAHASMKVTVNGMVCSFCAQGIEKSISKMSETKAVFVDLKNKVVVIEPKDGKTLNQKEISQEIKDAGYDVVKIETITQTVAQFKALQKDKK
jgi:mercuric ion binding protein